MIIILRRSCPCHPYLRTGLCKSWIYIYILTSLQAVVYGLCIATWTHTHTDAHTHKHTQMHILVTSKHYVLPGLLLCIFRCFFYAPEFGFHGNYLISILFTSIYLVFFLWSVDALHFIASFLLLYFIIAHVWRSNRVQGCINRYC